MKNIPAPLQAHLEQTTTTITTCIRVERLDGVVVTVTAFNRPLTIDSEVYSSIGFKPADMASGNDLDIPTTEVIGIVDDTTITENDLYAGLWDFARYELFQVNWASVAMGRIEVASGTLGVVRVGRLQFTAELLGLLQAVQISIGYVTSPACIHEFGASEGAPAKPWLGNGCTADLAPHTVTGTITHMSSDYYELRDMVNRTEATNFFSNGKITFTSGLLDGLAFEVRAYEKAVDGKGKWILFTAVPYNAVGCDYAMVRGCDKSLEMCRDVYNNLLDRLAFDFSQGGDAATQVARHNK